MWRDGWPRYPGAVVGSFLRRLALGRLLLLCAAVVAFGVGITALAFALDAGPTPPPKPLATAIHDAISEPAPQGFSAQIQYTNHLLEGANLASGAGVGGELASSPLLSGASGRLWVSKDGRARLELQSQKGDTEVVYDGHTLSIYETASNTVYRYTPPKRQGQGASGEEGSPEGASSGGSTGARPIPSVAKIEEALEHLSRHSVVSGATPSDVAGQPAYTVRVSPREHGGLIAGAELSFDAVHGVPLRAAVYSTQSSAPVIELAASEVSYEPVPDSVFELSPPPGAKIKEIANGSEHSDHPRGEGSTGKPKVSTHGQGLESIVLVEAPAKEGQSASSELPEGLQKVQINGATASELPTALGTVLAFERSGVRYLVAGALPAESIEAFARGL